ncbi:MAG: hypothetical protein ACRD47_07100 [Nitrososphaeraceae archaeon]|jgi:hypothetical protein
MQESLINKITIDIELDLEDEGKRDAIMKSLVADNINFPQGLEMHMHSLSESMLLIEFSTEGSIETVSNTVDEVLSHISIGKMVLNDD